MFHPVIKHVLLSLVGLVLFWIGSTEARTINIGVLAFRPASEMVATCTPFTASLKKAMPEHDFVISPLTYQGVERGIQNKTLDFVLTNPAHYVLLSKQFTLSAPLATLINKPDGNLTQFGGVIIVRSDRKDLAQLSDLQDKLVGIVNTKSFGGYHVQAYELSLIGLHQAKNYTIEPFGLPHDSVVRAVLSRQVDAGFVRTGVIEGMIRDGLLKNHQLTVLNIQKVDGFPYLLSTHLYPEWPMVALGSVDEKLVRQFTAALLTSDVTSPATDRISDHFFTPPQDYTPIENLLRELRLPPYNTSPNFTLLDIWEHYRWQLLIGLTLALLIAALSIKLLRTNTQLQAKHLKLESEIQLRHGLLNTMGEGVYGTNHQGICTIINPAALEMLGYTEAEVLGVNPHTLFHHTHADGTTHAEHNCLVKRTLSDGETRHCETWFIRKDGRGFPVELNISAHTINSHTVGVVVVFHDISERKTEEQRILHLAQHDALTDLPNRTLFDMHLSAALVTAKESGTLVAVMFVDLDNFKPVNDTFGHAIGDLLLQAVTRRIQQCLRESDLAARVGGDEFVVLLPDIQSTAQADIIASRIGQSLRKPFTLERNQIHISASIGYAIDFSHDLAPNEIKKQADIAMYQVKQNGRDHARAYAVEMNQPSS